MILLSLQIVNVVLVNLPNHKFGVAFSITNKHIVSQLRLQISYTWNIFNSKKLKEWNRQNQFQWMNVRENDMIELKFKHTKKTNDLWRTNWAHVMCYSMFVFLLHLVGQINNSNLAYSILLVANRHIHHKNELIPFLVETYTHTNQLNILFIICYAGGEDICSCYSRRNFNYHSRNCQSKQNSHKTVNLQKKTTITNNELFHNYFVSSFMPK